MINPHHVLGGLFNPKRVALIPDHGKPDALSTSSFCCVLALVFYSLLALTKQILAKLLGCYGVVEPPIRILPRRDRSSRYPAQTSMHNKQVTLAISIEQPDPRALRHYTLSEWRRHWNWALDFIYNTVCKVFVSTLALHRLKLGTCHIVLHTDVRLFSQKWHHDEIRPDPSNLTLRYVENNYIYTTHTEHPYNGLSLNYPS